MRRLDRILPWVGAAVLAAGVATFLVVYFARDNGGSSSNSQAAQTVQQQQRSPAAQASQKTVPVPAEVHQVTKEFVFTAVARKDLARSYALADQALKQGMSLKEWKTGNIPVQFYPAQNVKFSAVDWSHPTDVQLEIVIQPRHGINMRNGYFLIGLKKIQGHWIVDYWGPNSSIPGLAPQ